MPGWRWCRESGLAQRKRNVMARTNVLYLIIGALVVAVGVLGYSLYQSKKEPTGVEIKVGPGGLSIEKK
jgi:RsiW-degrading membrane proteinase PrsW (M82 family)